MCAPMSPKRAVLAKRPKAVLIKLPAAYPLVYRYAVVVEGRILSIDNVWSGSALGAWNNADRYLAAHFDDGRSKA
jgi:hypothetical protein